MMRRSAMKRNVNLCQARHLPGLPKTGKREYGDWIYLGYSYRPFLDLEKVLGKSEEMKTFHRRIGKKAEELRDAYVKSISEVSEKNRHVAWHLSDVAENNTMTSNLFLDVCYLSICNNILEEKGEDLLIVVENKDLFSALEKDLEFSSAAGTRTLLESRGKHGLEALRTALRASTASVRTAVGFLKRMMGRKRVFRSDAGKGMGKLDNGNVVLVHTFANDGCFGEDGVFRERFFGELPERLKEAGFKVVYLLHTGYASKSLSEIADWCRASNNAFLFVEQLVTIRDLLRALLLPFELLRVNIGSLSAVGVGISGLIRKKLWRECLNGNVRNPYLYYAAVKNLASRGNTNIRYFLDIYEGHVPERALRLAAKRFMPNCRTIGVSHTCFSTNHLSFFTSVSGSNYSVSPDILLCTGEAYKKIFLKQGFLGQSVYAVGNLRQGAAEGYDSSSPRSGRRNRILVALPLLLNDAQELVWKVYQAFSGTECEVSIYKHPMMAMELLDIMIEGGDDGNIRFAEQPTAKGLQECDLVITTGSNVSADALKEGLPVISVVRTIGLSFEPLDWFESNVRYCCTPDEIREEAVKILSLPEEVRMEEGTVGKHLVDSCLGKINSKAMDSLLSRLTGV